MQNIHMGTSKNHYFSSVD